MITSVLNISSTYKICFSTNTKHSGKSYPLHTHQSICIRIRKMFDAERKQDRNPIEFFFRGAIEGDLKSGRAKHKKWAFLSHIDLETGTGVRADVKTEKFFRLCERQSHDDRVFFPRQRHKHVNSANIADAYIHEDCTESSPPPQTAKGLLEKPFPNIDLLSRFSSRFKKSYGAFRGGRIRSWLLLLLTSRQRTMGEMYGDRAKTEAL